MAFLNHLYLSNRFFYLFGGVVLLLVLAFPFPFLFPIAQTALVMAALLVGIDYYLLFRHKTPIKCKRFVPKVLSLGDEQDVRIELQNLSKQAFQVELIDELPVQLQERDFQINFSLNKKEERHLTYSLQPKERGEYLFKTINIFISSFLGLVERRIQHHYEMNVPVYPSILQMKKYELLANDRIAHQAGLKKIRRLGHSYEFEQIKNYVPGDDYRSINWKATSRRGVLMVNQYEDERAQQVYCVIDKSRTMRMPFDGLSLMDYAINTALVISNVILQKHDKAGLLTFSNVIGTTIKADRKTTQLNKILAALYKEKERDLEANYELLYHSARKLIIGRSLLILFTNFESKSALERVLPILRKINNLHLLVVVFFKNTEIEDFTKKPSETVEEIYHQTIARKYISEKQQMIQTLQQYGIQSILTRPEDLSINTLNKYLELKSRGLI